jgi:hypothetical protein
MRRLASPCWGPAAAVLIVTLAIAWGTGCNTGTALGSGRAETGPDEAGGANQEADSPEELQPGLDQVVIRFLNSSDVDVDTEFYATNQPLDDPPTELFAAEYRVQVGIGAFGSGVVLSGQADEIVFPCTDTTVLGTAGGKYRDPDLGTLLGSGQARIIKVSLNFDCGNTIIFTYRSEDGEYSTEPPMVDFTD